MTANGADGNGTGVAPGVSPSEAGEGARPLVAFDFDGTLTVRDSFNAFLAWRAGPLGLAFGLRALAPEALVYAARRDRGRFKAAAVRVFLRGTLREHLAQQAAAFAGHAAAGLLRPDALAAWAEHRRRGERLAIVTASPEILVEPFARRLGADVLIGTRLAFDEAGRVLGALDGPNCRGEEKVRRLRQKFGPGVRLQTAYGDTAGDREMLALAERGVMGGFTGRPGR